MLLISLMGFVGREKELLALRRYLDEVRRGNGRIVLLEGPVGIGKTALLNRFLEDIKDAQILKSKGEPSTQYVPYSALSQALRDYGTLREIKRNEWKRRISEIAERIYDSGKVILIDEIGYGGGYRIYKEITKKLKGIYFTIREPKREDGIWLTETKTSKKSVNPYNIEFEFLSHIYDFLNTNEKRVVYIENINYLVYIAGVERVVDFLHTIRSISYGKHVIILSGKLEYLSEEEKKNLLGIFDEKIIVEWDDEIEPATLVLTEKLEGSDVFILSDKRIANKRGLYISPHGTHPSRLDFEIFDNLSNAINEGMHIGIECLRTLIHYNDKRRVYIWLKAVIDYARKHRKKVYLLYTPSIEKDIEFFLDLIDEGKEKLYSGSRMMEHGAVKFYDVIYNFLSYYSRRKPFILIFEDIQWIDINSLELIYYLSRNISNTKIMIILTYRNEDIVENRNIVNLLVKLQSENNVRIIRLKPLRKVDIKNILEELGYTGDIDLIYEGSEGNPLLSINMAKYLVEGKMGQIPETIKESIEMQIDRLDELHLNFIRFLSVVGNEIPIELVEDFYPEYELFLPKIEKLFVKRENNTLKFVYSPYREVIYRAISRDTRIELHRKIGEWAERKNRLFLAAYHYYMARNEKAIKFLKLAAEESKNMLAFKSAIEYLQKAIEIAIKYEKTREIGELYKLLGEWYIAVGEYNKAVDVFSQAQSYLVDEEIYIGTKIGMCYRLMGELESAKKVLEKYLKIAEGMDKARILGELGIIAWETGDFVESLRNLKSYLEWSKKHGSEIDEVRAMRNIASVYYMEGKYKNALKYAENALNLAEKIGDIQELADTYNVLGVINNHLGNYTEALKYLVKYREISEKIGNMSYLARAYNNIGVTYEKMGEIKRAEECHKKSIDIIEKLGNDRLLEIFYNNLGVLYCRHGDYSHGLDYLNRSLGKSKRLNNKYGICERLISLGEVSVEMGKYFDGIDLYLRAIEIAKEHQYINLLFAGYLYMSRAYIFLKEFKKAKEYLTLAQSLKKDIQEDYLLMDYYLINAEYEIYSGNMEYAMKWTSRAKKEAIKIKDIINLGYIEVLEAYLICRKDIKEAKKIFEQNIRKYMELDYKRYLAESYYYYALCLFDVDKSKGREMLYKVKRLYENMDLKDKVIEIEKIFNEILF